MGKALAVYHGRFGRASLYQLGHEMATHAHREGHLTFCIAGHNAHMMVSDLFHGLTPETAAACNPWQPHSFHPGDRETGCIFLVLYIRPEWFRRMAPCQQTKMQFGDTVIHINSVIARAVKQVSRLLLTGVCSDLFDGYLYELTQESFDQSWRFQSAKGAPLTQNYSFGDFRIRNAIKLMKSRLGDGEGIRLNTIARESGLSRPHFFKLFRENLGLTPNIYLNTLRMEMAIDQLTRSDEAVTSIGLDLGFSSQASFSRFFVSNVGIPPSDYRRVAQHVS
jgi:AraC-like DNA-binding protein